MKHRNTVVESGCPGYDATGWGAIFVPNGTPQPIVNKLNATIAKVATSPEVKKSFEDQGTEAASSTQAEMAKLLREGFARLGDVAKGARAEGELSRWMPGERV